MTIKIKSKINNWFDQIGDRIDWVDGQIGLNIKHLIWSTIGSTVKNPPSKTQEVALYQQEVVLYQLLRYIKK